MRYLPGRGPILGCLFLGIGYSLIRYYFEMDQWMHLEWYAELLFPHNLAYQYYFRGISGFGLLAISGLSFLTGWGAMRKSRWARWMGLAPCAYLLFGFPYLTAVGAAGLYLLFTQDTTAPRPRKDFWDPNRGSPLRTAIFLVTWILATRTLATVGPGRLGAPLLALLIVVHIAIHELGHAAGALLVGFRLKEIVVGPIVYRYGRHNSGFSFSWRNVLNSIAGYVGAVPLSRENVWRNETVMIAAGPLASLAAGGVFLCGAWLTPGTLMAFGAMIGFHMALMNLVPLGYSDGTMLLHLVLRTRRGEELIESILTSAEQDAAREQESSGDYQELAATRRATLDRSLESKTADPPSLAIAYIELGHAEAQAQKPCEAEKNLLRGLDILPQGHSPYHSVLGWLTLHHVYVTRFDASSASNAYQRCLAAYEVLHAQYTDSPELAAHRASNLGDLHLTAHAHKAALEAVADGLKNFPAALDQRLMKASLLSIRAQAALQTGDTALGLAAAEESAAILLAEDERDPASAAMQSLGVLAYRLWQGGFTSRAIGLLTQCIAILEARGTHEFAMNLRFTLAGFLRNEGRLAEATAALPQEDRLPASLRRTFVSVRGDIRDEQGKYSEALNDGCEMMRLTVASSPNDPIAIAVTKTRLAGAYLEAGHREQAEALAKQSYDPLRAANHIACSDACITLGMIAHQKGKPGAFLEEALRILMETPFVLDSDRVYYLTNAANYFERMGAPQLAAPFRDAAASIRRSHGPAADLCAATLESV